MFVLLPTIRAASDSLVFFSHTDSHSAFPLYIVEATALKKWSLDLRTGVWGLRFTHLTSKRARETMLYSSKSDSYSNLLISYFNLKYVNFEYISLRNDLWPCLHKLDYTMGVPAPMLRNWTLWYLLLSLASVALLVCLCGYTTWISLLFHSLNSHVAICLNLVRRTSFQHCSCMCRDQWKKVMGGKWREPNGTSGETEEV